MSFQNYTTSTFYTGDRAMGGLGELRHRIQGLAVWTTLINTAVFTAGSIAGQFVIGMAIALFFKRRFPLSGILRSLLLLPWLLPLIASSCNLEVDPRPGQRRAQQTLLFFHVIASPVPWLEQPGHRPRFGDHGQHLARASRSTRPSCTAGCKVFPEELYEAGALDGATGWKAFRYITWPNLRPIVSVVLVLGVVYTLKVRRHHPGLTGGGPANATQTLATNCVPAVVRAVLLRQGRRNQQHPGGLSRCCSPLYTCV